MASSAFKKALASVEKKAGNVVKNVNTNGVIKRVVLDSPRLNFIYGGGIAVGRIHRMIGPESGGKSTVCTYIASQFQKHLKSQLGFDKPYVLYIDFERTFDAEHAEDMGLLIDEDHFKLLQPDDIETAAIALEELVKTGEVGMIIIDSESMATTKTLNDKEVGTANFGNFAKVFGDFLKRFNTLCANYGTTMMVISQERCNMCVTESVPITFLNSTENNSEEPTVTAIGTFIEKYLNINLDDMEVKQPIYVGDQNYKILSFNENTGKVEFSKVNYVIKKEKQKNYIIKVVEREQPEFPMSGDHSVAIYKHDDNKVDYTFVKDLRKGMKLLSENGNELTIESITKADDNFVYDLNTDNGNYYTNGFLSHNTMMSHAIQTCITKDTFIKVYKNDDFDVMSIEDFFGKVGYDYKEMEQFKFYDISDKEYYIDSYNEIDGTRERKLIEGIVYKGKAKVYELHSPEDKVLLRGSAQHKVFDVINKKYVSFEEIGDDDITVLTQDQNTLTCFVEESNKTEAILDIQVQDNHNYYPNGILSHNTGGFLLKYSASTLMRVKKIDTIKVDGKDAGIYMNVRNYKNKTGIPWRECDMMLYFKNGFDSDLEYVDFIKEFNDDKRLEKYVKIGGAYYKSDEYGFSICGKDKFLEWTKDSKNKDAWDKIKSVITEIISKSVAGDEKHTDPELMSEEELAKLDERPESVEQETPEVELED